MFLYCSYSVLYQFGNQEFETSKEIKSFVTESFGVTFDLYSKINVKKNANVHPIFGYLLKSDVNQNQKIKWNFDGKFVVDGTGKVIARFTNKDDLSAIDQFVGEKIQK